MSEVGIRIAPLSYKRGEDTLAMHDFAENRCLGILGGERPSGRMRIEAAQLQKGQHALFYKRKVIIANQVRAYSSSLAFSLSNSVPASWMSERACAGVQACYSC